MGFPTAIQAIEFAWTRRDSPAAIWLHSSQFRQGLGGAFRKKAHHNVYGSRPSPPSWHTRRSTDAGTGRKPPDDIPDMEWARFPLKNMVRAGLASGCFRAEGPRRRAHQRTDGSCRRSAGLLFSQCIARTITGGSTPRRTTTPCVHGAGRYGPGRTESAAHQVPGRRSYSSTPAAACPTQRIGDGPGPG